MSDTDHKPLAGQAALVTGAGRGIGAAIAAELATAGASVALLGRGAEALEATGRAIGDRGGRFFCVMADVRDNTAVTTAVQAVHDRFGRLDILVNNAGTGAAIGPLHAVDEALWWADVETVLRGTANCVRAVVPTMIQTGGGRIINITSRAGSQAAPYHSAYACSRAALFSLTEALAGELAEHAIAVFAMTPGIVRTQLTSEILESEGGRRWLGKFADVVRDGQAWVDPRVVGHAVVELATGRADVLSGRWIHAGENLDALLAAAADDPDDTWRTLRLGK